MCAVVNAFADGQHLQTVLAWQPRPHLGSQQCFKAHAANHGQAQPVLDMALAFWQAKHHFNLTCIARLTSVLTCAD